MALIHQPGVVQEDEERRARLVDVEPIVVANFLRAGKHQADGAKVFDGPQTPRVVVERPTRRQHTGERGGSARENTGVEGHRPALDQHAAFAGGEAFDAGAGFEVDVAAAQFGFEPVDDGGKTAAEVTELLPRAARTARVAPRINPRPEPGHGDGIVVAAELAFQQRRPDSLHRLPSAGPGHPGMGGLAGKTAPVLCVLQVKGRQAQAEPSEQTARLKAQQVQRRRERIAPAIAVNPDGAVAPHKLIAQPELMDQSQNGRIRPEDVVIRFLDRRAEHREPRGQPAQLAARLQQRHREAGALGKLVGGG